MGIPAGCYWHDILQLGFSSAAQTSPHSPPLEVFPGWAESSGNLQLLVDEFKAIRQKLSETRMRIGHTSGHFKCTDGKREVENHKFITKLPTKTCGMGADAGLLESHSGDFFRKVNLSRCDQH